VLKGSSELIEGAPRALDGEWTKMREEAWGSGEKGEHKREVEKEFFFNKQVEKD
jgi:hypothetical protein